MLKLNAAAHHPSSQIKRFDCAREATKRAENRTQQSDGFAIGFNANSVAAIRKASAGFFARTLQIRNGLPIHCSAATIRILIGFSMPVAWLAVN